MQHKFCTLKDVVPGSVVEVPKEYRLTEGESAVILDLGYTKDKKFIQPYLIRKGLNIQPLPALLPETQLTLMEDESLLKELTLGFIKGEVALPDLWMSAGCDPELFVNHGDGTLFPAWEFLQDEEEARRTAKEWASQDFKEAYKNDDGENVTRFIGAGSAQLPSNVSLIPFVPAYWDGAQAEIAPWGKTCLQVLHHGTRAGLKAVIEAARKKDPKAKLTLQNVVELPEGVLQKADIKFIQFRCTPSFNVYNDAGMGLPDARSYKYRCAGGHVHIGVTRKFTAPGIEQIVRGLDGVLGVAGVSLAAGIDNPERRNTYGRAGEFRLPEHGLEYRVLSNFWLSQPGIAMLVFEIARATVRLAESGLYNACWNAREEEVREVINNCDVDGARTILKKNVAVLRNMLKSIWKPMAYFAGSGRSQQVVDNMVDFALKTVLNGIEVAVDEPGEIEKNWKIDDPEAWGRYCKGNDWQALTEAKHAN